MKVKNIDMQSLLRRIFFTFTLNLSFFLILMIGIQNSSTKRKVNLLINKTVSLPIGFVLGISFISGSLMGSLYKIELKDKE
tara:strand:+ start:221 stop:463 length:243 start_codon:yes stop_codon:yes gene_type:complete